MGDQINGLLSPWLREKRIKQALPFLKGRILDFGCGTGKTSEFTEKHVYIGIDKDKFSIETAKITYPNKTFYLLTKNFKLTLLGKFDTIIVIAVIEHLKNPRKILEKLKILLNINGKIVITTPPPYSNLIHKIGSKLRLFSKEAHNEHETLFNKKMMARLAKESGLKLTKSKKFLFGINQLFILEQINS